MQRRRRQRSSIEERDDFDGNVLQVSLNSEKGVTGQLNLLTGNLFASNTAAVKNFVFHFGDQMYNNSNNDAQGKGNSRLAKWKFLQQGADAQSASSTDQNKPSRSSSSLWETLSFILNNILRVGPMMLVLFGFLAFRYAYLKKREKKLDFVDLAMQRRF